MSVYDQKIIPEDARTKCVPSHWDATMIYKYSIPTDQTLDLPLTPRPYAKICLEYRTSAPFTAAPAVPDAQIFPGASDRYPVTRFIENIDVDSIMERLDRPLHRDELPSVCPEVPQYFPNEKGDMFEQRLLLPARRGPANPMDKELMHPSLLRNLHGYQCTQQEMKVDDQYNSKIWFNATKQQKFNDRKGAAGDRFGYVQGDYASAENLPKVYAK